MVTTCQKKFSNFPFAHRQHTHKGHCAAIHGHSWDFQFTFKADTPDANGFILDFGDLGWLKEWLNRHFDHTLVLAEDDPIFHRKDYACITDFAAMTSLPSASCEGIAAFVFKHVDALVWTKTAQRVSLVAVTVWESPNNSATIRAPHGQHAD